MAEQQKRRLPVVVVPNHYDLKYTKIDLVHHVYDGVLTMDVTVPEGGTAWGRPSLLLHSLELQILSCSLVKSASADEESNAKEESWLAIEYRYNIPRQTVEIIFDNFPGWAAVPGGAAYTVQMNFQGILNDQMRGLYRSTYTGLDGQSHTMATTQFEATDARRAFPCVDEPACKATFQLTITIPSHLQCISNTPFESVHTKFIGTASMKTVTYQKTPKMSTYLLALVVGEFDAISTTCGSIQTTVYTVPGKAQQGEFCLETASRCLELYQNLFSIPYPLVKSDLLAIPDFAAGAMENWGCVTYREAKILVKEGSTSETTRRGIARTVCHELAHQWFGNLVTMEFWTQLWLNEGFARFMEFVGIDTLFPGWDAWTEFVQSVYGLAQSLDSMKSSHPVEVEVHHPDEINDIFDAISYAKGASIIRMISSHLGFDTFMQGLKIYLKRHAYGNAKTEMLWQALEEASGKPVAGMMNPWTLQTGFPLLQLTADGSLETPRFLASGPGSDVSEHSCSWPVPVTAIVEGEDEVQGPWIIKGPEGDDTPVLLENISKWTAAGKWFKLNADQTAFVRVAYTPEQWQSLGPAMSPKGQLSAIDRLGLISDSFAAGRGGYSSIVDSLRLVDKFGEHEMADYAVWQELSENLADLASVYRSEPFFPKFQAYLRKIYSKQMEILGWDAKEGESQRTGTLRAAVISMMGKAGDEGIREEAYRRFCAFDQDGVNIPGDLQRNVFRLALQHDEEKAIAALTRIYEKSTFPEEQRNCLSIMGCVKDMKRHADVMEYALFSGKVRLQDAAFTLNTLSSSSDVGGRACWKAFQTQYDRFHAKFFGGPMWGACVGLSCRGLRTLAEADEVESFFQAKPPGSAKRRLIQGLEAVRTRATRLERDREQVAAFL